MKTERSFWINSVKAKFLITTRIAIFVLLAGLTVAATSSGAVEIDLNAQHSYQVDTAIAPNAMLEIRLDQSPLISVTFPAWAQKWRWVGSHLSLSSNGKNRSKISGNIKGLDVEIGGAVFSRQANQLVYQLTLDAQSSFKDIMGAGFQFTVDPAIAQAAGIKTKPALLPENRGWEWSFGNGQILRVEFDPPLPNIYMERGNAGTIRAMFIGNTLVPGHQTYTMTVTLPEGGTASPTTRMAAPDQSNWYKDALDAMASPIDLSFLNDAPAGKHGFARADGDSIRFADGTPARFWGGTIAAGAIYQPKEVIKKQCKRIAALGFNLIRIHHQDSMQWVGHTVIDKTREDSQHLDDDTMDRLDYWISCLRDHGVYVWLDLHVGRLLKPGDDVPGFTEISAHSKNDPKGAEFKGYNYFNTRIEQLMQDMNAKYLGHVNKYTGLAYKDDPAILAVLLTNEDDLPAHFGNLMLPDKNNPFHNAIFNDAVKAYAAKYDLPPNMTWQTWVPGPSKLFLADREAQWNMRMIANLKSIGAKPMTATTQLFGNTSLFVLPALTIGDLISVNSYGSGGFLEKNPRYVANFLGPIAMAQLADKPMAVTEWNVPYPAKDRFMAPLYVASTAALQGWDALMIYNYSQSGFRARSPLETWSTYSDLAYTGMMPAAALLYRRGDVREGQKQYVLKLSRASTYYQSRNASNLKSLRTLLEKSRVSLALPEVKENPWLKPTKIPTGATVVTDLDRDFLASNATRVESDTGELMRDWAKGYQTIDTKRSQAVNGHVCGAPIKLGNVSFDIATCYASVDIASLDDAPIETAKNVFITAIARVAQGPAHTVLSEPVKGTITFKAPAGGTLYALDGEGHRKKVDIAFKDGVYHLTLPVMGGTHWFLLSTH